MDYTFANGQILTVYQGDLLEQPLDAIVNAANSHLQHGGGIAGMIVKRGGELIQRESDLWVQAHGKVEHDCPAFTSAGKLQFRYIIHAVGPVWGSGDEDRKLQQAIHCSLRLAEELKVTSLGFPAISTGIYGFPVDRAPRVFFNTIWEYYQALPQSIIGLVSIVLFDQQSHRIFREKFDQWRREKA